MLLSVNEEAWFHNQKKVLSEICTNVKHFTGNILISDKDVKGTFTTTYEYMT